MVLLPAKNKAPGDFDAALKWALESIARSDKLEAELNEGLKRYGFSDADRAAVLAYLRDTGIVRDRNTIAAHIKRRSGRKPIGRDKIRAELLARGAPEDLIEECLAAGNPEDESDKARAALRGRFKGPIDRARAGRFLVGRGFAEETIATVLDTVASSECE